MLLNLNCIDRLWRKAFLFLPPIPLDCLSLGSVSFAIETFQIKKKTEYYIAQLGLPLKEDSEKFHAMKPELRERMKKFYPVENDKCFLCRLLERTASCSYRSPHPLDEMEKLALRLLDDAVKACFIRRISVASNAIQTIDNEMIHIITYCLNCIRRD